HDPEGWAPVFGKDHAPILMQKNKTAGLLVRPLARMRRIRSEIRMAPPTLRAEVISRRTGLSVEHRMAAAALVAPLAPSAALCDGGEVAHAWVRRHGHDTGRHRGGGKPERQGGTQIDRFHLHVRLLHM